VHGILLSLQVELLTMDKITFCQFGALTVTPRVFLHEESSRVRRYVSWRLTGNHVCVLKRPRHDLTRDGHLGRGKKVVWLLGLPELRKLLNLSLC